MTIEGVEQMALIALGAEIFKFVCIWIYAAIWREVIFGAFCAKRN